VNWGVLRTVGMAFGFIPMTIGAPAGGGATVT
jgi:hypothetical protein